MVKNHWKWLEMVGNGQQRLKMEVKMAGNGNGQKQLEMAVNNRKQKWVKMKLAGNGVNVNGNRGNEKKKNK